MKQQALAQRGGRNFSLSVIGKHKKGEAERSYEDLFIHVENRHAFDTHKRVDASL